MHPVKTAIEVLCWSVIGLGLAAVVIVGWFARFNSDINEGKEDDRDE